MIRQGSFEIFRHEESKWSRMCSLPQSIQLHVLVSLSMEVGRIPKHGSRFLHCFFQPEQKGNSHVRVHNHQEAMENVPKNGIC